MQPDEQTGGQQPDGLTSGMRIIGDRFIHMIANSPKNASHTTNFSVNRFVKMQLRNIKIA